MTSHPACCTLFTLAACASTALAQPTAFTYQGRLTDNAQPAAGLHDFRFRLYDAQNAGVQVGSTLCIDNLQVTDGLFVATLDFGNQFTAGARRFIEVEVRRDTGLTCANAGGFVVLAARQLITPAPLATRATSAFALSAPDGSPANGWFFHRSSFNGDFLQLTDTINGAPQFQRGLALSKGGNVGIGTTTPSSKLTVVGNVQLGANAEYFAPGAQENLRIIRGEVAANGTILRGTGFTVINDMTGLYLIYFTTPFADTVTATVTPNISGGAANSYPTALLNTTSASHVRVFIRDVDANTFRNFPFQFIAVGPR
jgi:hypothetical protein